MQHDGSSAPHLISTAKTMPIDTCFGNQDQVRVRGSTHPPIMLQASHRHPRSKLQVPCQALAWNARSPACDASPLTAVPQAGSEPVREPVHSDWRAGRERVAHESDWSCGSTPRPPTARSSVSRPRPRGQVRLGCGSAPAGAGRCAGREVPERVRGGCPD